MGVFVPNYLARYMVKDRTVLFLRMGPGGRTGVTFVALLCHPNHGSMQTADQSYLYGWFSNSGVLAGGPGLGQGIASVLSL